MHESRPIRQEITVQNCSTQEVYEFVECSRIHAVGNNALTRPLPQTQQIMRIRQWIKIESMVRQNRPRAP
jgi:hypothetical protein